MKRLVLLQLTLAWLFAVTAIAAQSNEDEEKKKGGFTLDVAFGWTATRGNDVQLGDRTTVSDDALFDEETVFAPIGTRMENDYMPIVRAGYEWEEWGVQGEYWHLETGGSLDGSFENSGPGRSELVQVWNAWHGEYAGATSYAAENDLSVRSIRVDLTRALTRTASLTAGLHVAEYKNSRGENVLEVGPVPLDFLEVTEEAESAVKGWLYGPSVGLRGSARFGKSAWVAFSFSQSVLFGELDHEASWIGSVNFPMMPTIAVDTALTSRVAVPVTDLRLDLTFDIGDHVSVGGFAFVSAWVDVPMARVFSMPLEQFDAPKSTLVFASFGPVVKVRF